MRAAVLLFLLGGCLIVETYEDNPGEFCPPDPEWEVITSAAGPLAISGDQLYYLRTGDVLSRIATTGGPITDLTRVNQPPYWLVVDASFAYWAELTHTITKVALTGGSPTVVVANVLGITNLAVDDIGIVYASDGLYRIRHADGIIETIASGRLISGLAQHAGTYFFADVELGVIRRAPDVDLATALFPGPVVADERAVYYYENGPPGAEAAGAIRLVNPQGSPPVATVDNIRGPVVAVVMDADNLYFATNVAGDYRIKRVSRFGGTVTRLVCNYLQDAPIYLVQDADFLYWSDAQQIYRIAKTAGK